MITIDEASKLKIGTEIYVIDLYNADGTPKRFRVNGNFKTWKKRPDEFKLPIRHGLKDSDYLHEGNCHKFTLNKPESIKRSEVKETNSKFRWY